MRLSLISTAVISAFSISTAALAQTETAPAAPLAPKTGELIRSSDGASIGRIDTVYKSKDGAVQAVGVIYDMRVVHIPVDSLSAAPNGFKTSLTKHDVAKLR
jgi:hypothetical protein